MVDGATIRHETELEILCECFLVEVAGPAAGAQRPNGRREADAAVSLGIHEGFYPQPVANQVQRALCIVPQRKREHPPQTGDQAMDSPAVVSMQQDFGVGPATELRAGGGELRRQRAKVVDRAVEDDPQGSVGRHHRLPAGIAEVENGEAPMTEHDVRPAFETLAVRPSPGQRVDHLLDSLERQGRVLEPDYASNPAHVALKAANRGVTSDGMVRLRPRSIRFRRRRPDTKCTKCGRSSG